MKLSVIVPVYNLERCLAAALDSLLGMEFPYRYEIIVVNDGSTDGSRAIAEEYQNKTEFIRLLNTENGGVSRARNLGLSAAAGEYVTFVDGDDTVEPDFFAEAVRELDDGGYDFVQTNLRIVSKNGSGFVRFNAEDLALSDRDGMLERFFGPKKTLSNSVCGKIFRAERIRGMCFDPSLRIAEDQKFVFDAILVSQKIKLLSTAGYNYYQRSESAMHSLDRNRAADILNVLDYCRERVGSEPVRTLIDADRLDILLYIYHDALRRGEDRTGICREIEELDLNAAGKAMSAKGRAKLALFEHARFLYDLILIGRRLFTERAAR